MKKGILAILVMIGAVSAPAAVAQQDGGEKKASFEKAVYPFEGEVTASRLFVRRSPKAGDPKGITTILKQGAKLIVVGEQADFYKILPVAGCSGYIFARNIKREGSIGTVLFDRSPVRSDSRSNADKFCMLQKGAKVKVLNQRMGWMKIQLPPTVKFFVSKRYVKFLRNLKDKDLAGTGIEPVKKAAPKTDFDGKALAKIKLAEDQVASLTEKIKRGDLENLDFGGIVRLYEDAEKLAKADWVKQKAASGINHYRNLLTVWELYLKGKKELEAKIKKLGDQLAERRRKAKPKTYAFRGYLFSTSATTSNAPGRLKLTATGDRRSAMICFIKGTGKVKFVRITDHWGQYVGVNGTVIQNAWQGFSAIIVDEIVRLPKPKK